MIFLLSLFILITPSKAYNDVSSRQLFLLNNALSCPYDEEPQYSTPLPVTVTDDGTQRYESRYSLPPTSGRAVALSGNGDVLAIGDPLANVVRVFGKSITSSFTEDSYVESQYWEQVGQDMYGNLGFGASVALSEDGDILAVGRFWNIWNGDENKSNPKGAIHLFQRNSSTTLGWIQSSEQNGEDINGKFPDESLTSVAISGEGNIVAVSAVYRTHEEYSMGNSVHDVRVFKFDMMWKYDHYALGWSQIGLDILRVNYIDFKDSNIAISKSGSILAINAIQRFVYDDYGDGMGYSKNWYVSIYERDETSALGWKQIGQDLTGVVGHFYFQTSVALSRSGDIIAIGSTYQYSSCCDKENVHVRVYHRDTSTIHGWTQVGSDLELSVKGIRSLSLSLSDDGSILAFGADYDDYSYYSHEDFGIFRRDPSSALGWTQVTHQDANLDVEEPGWYVSLLGDGSKLAVGGQSIYDSTVKIYHVSCFTSSSSSTTSKMTTMSTVTLVFSVVTLVLVIAVIVSNYFLYKNIAKQKSSCMNISAESTDVSQEAPIVQEEQGRVESTC